MTQATVVVDLIADNRTEVACTATHVTPTESGRWLVFVEGKGYPVTVLDELPDRPTVLVEPDVTVFLDPSEVITVFDSAFFAPSRRVEVDQ
ncbi:hypothetical protein AB0383_50020 [Amycolatopsis sp. NPDC051373]|uniref:hypothetical protein n=1 Tax=Amycolatopsis sp. NPDC051373 TaxID=3155801 RepID=UPI00344CD665